MQSVVKEGERRFASAFSSQVSNFSDLNVCTFNSLLVDYTDLSHHV